MKFHRENWEKLPLESQISYLELHNEETLIRQPVGSFRAQIQVTLCVFLLISFPVSLYFNFKS